MQSSVVFRLKVCLECMIIGSNGDKGNHKRLVVFFDVEYEYLIL